MAKKKELELASPWITFARKMYKLFEHDPEVKVEWVADELNLKLYVASAEKAEALEAVLPMKKTFGNITMIITVIPANEVKNDPWALYQTAFKGNAAVSFVDEIDAAGFHAGYIVFQPEVVQYVNDNIGDIHGIESMLYQDIANEVFDEHPGIFFCTDIDDQKFLGRPLGEWP